MFVGDMSIPVYNKCIGQFIDWRCLRNTVCLLVICLSPSTINVLDSSLTGVVYVTQYVCW